MPILARVNPIRPDEGLGEVGGGEGGGGGGSTCADFKFRKLP